MGIPEDVLQKNWAFIGDGPLLLLALLLIAGGVCLILRTRALSRLPP